MVLKPVQAGTHCPFARLASPDCLFIGSQGCTLVPGDSDHSLFVSFDEYREDMLAEQAGRFDTNSGREIRGPFNRLLIIPNGALDHERGANRAIMPTFVKTNAIDVSTPLYPRDLMASLSVCVAVIGTRTEEGAGVFNILVHLLPSGHLRDISEPFQADCNCCSNQLGRWMSNGWIESRRQRKLLFLTAMLNIFRGREWEITIATPLIKDSNLSRWISHVDVKRHLVEELGYDKDKIRTECTRNVKVASNGKTYFGRDAR